MNSFRLFIIAFAVLLANLAPVASSQAQQGQAGDAWGIAQADWLNESGAWVRARIDLVQQRSRIEAGVKAGDSRARVLAAMAYQRGAWGERDLARANELLRQAAEQGDIRAAAVLAESYTNDPSRQAVGIKMLAEAAAKGSGLAAAVLGFSHDAGKGVAKDPALAASWYRRAAEAGSTAGMRYWAFALVNGSGVTANPSDSRRWASQAAERGDEEAMRLLAVIAEKGLVGAKDEALSVDWYRKAAEAGSVEAAVELAGRYETGKGVVADRAKAVPLYERAAAAGSVQASARLGALYGSNLIGSPESLSGFLCARHRVTSKEFQCNARATRPERPSGNCRPFPRNWSSSSFPVR